MRIGGNNYFASVLDAWVSIKVSDAAYSSAGNDKYLFTHDKQMYAAYTASVEVNGREPDTRLSRHEEAGAARRER